MNDGTDAEVTSAESADEGPLVIPQQDWLLQDLVGFANQWNVGAGITLNVSGAMVSGELISMGAYLDALATQFKEGLKGNPELGQTFFDLISSRKPEEPKIDDPLPKYPPNYIHMRNVRTYVPGRPRDSFLVPVWRGRISEVSGFFLGTPSVPESH